MASETQLLHSSHQPYFDVFGPLVQFLNTPQQSGNRFCLIKATIPPGVAIPIHRHPDPEALYVIDGLLEFLQFNGDSHSWLKASGGDAISVSPNAKHALRNKSSDTVNALLITTPKIYSFFREFDKPFDQRQPHTLPTTEDLDKLSTLSLKYRYWIASPEEHAAVGLADLVRP